MRGPGVEYDGFLDSKMRRAMASCLSGMVVLLIMMFIADFVRLGIGGDFNPLKTDPGETGVWILSVLVCLNLLAQVSIHLADSKYAKMLLVGFVGFYGLFFLAHQIIHYRLGGFDPDVHLLLDISHHALSGIALWCGIKWIKMPAQGAAE